MKCACCGSESHYWTLLRRRLPASRFWRRWNMGYTKRVLGTAPDSAMARALLSTWPGRVRRALVSRYPEAGRDRHAR